MNTNGKSHPDDMPQNGNTAPVAACLGLLATVVTSFFCGGVAMILVVQPALLNLVAACLAR